MKTMIDGKMITLSAEEANKFTALWSTPPVNNKNKVYKTTIWKRCTDEEYNTLKLAMSQTSARYQAIFDDAAYISQEDELYPLVLSVATASVGEERALELLEPEF